MVSTGPGFGSKPAAQAATRNETYFRSKGQRYNPSSGPVGFADWLECIEEDALVTNIYKHIKTAPPDKDVAEARLTDAGRTRDEIVKARADYAEWCEEYKEAGTYLFYLIKGRLTLDGPFDKFHKEQVASYHASDYSWSDGFALLEWLNDEGKSTSAKGQALIKKELAGLKLGNEPSSGACVKYTTQFWELFFQITVNKSSMTVDDMWTTMLEKLSEE